MEGTRSIYQVPRARRNNLLLGLRISREGKAALLFLAPALVLFGVFLIWPVIYSFYIAFTEFNVLAPPRWVGLRNFSMLINDSLFNIAVRNTCLYVLITVPVTVTLGLLLALVANSKIRFRDVFRTVYYLPSVTSTIAIAMVWLWLYNPDIGLFNFFLQKLGIPPKGWLQDPRMALSSVMLLSIWRGVGYAMIIFLAGLQGIPDYLYEAAKIDGATERACLLYITIPSLKPVLSFMLITSIISGFQVFGEIYALTSGGPANATTTIVHQIYINGFRHFTMGYAAAMSLVLFIMIFIPSVLNFKILSTELT